jgi:DNA invertase Pin-like site-specific DNA recombinase
MHRRPTFDPHVALICPRAIKGLHLPQDMTETYPENRRLGYARVSTYGQTLDAQLEQQRAAGCSIQNIYREKVAGAHSDRRELLRMLDRLAPGDVVTVTRLDRLARSTRDLLNTLAAIADRKPRVPLAHRHMGRH